MDASSMFGHQMTLLRQQQLGEKRSAARFHYEQFVSRSFNPFKQEVIWGPGFDVWGSLNLLFWPCLRVLLKKTQQPLLLSFWPLVGPFSTWDHTCYCSVARISLFLLLIILLLSTLHCGILWYSHPSHGALGKAAHLHLSIKFSNTIFVIFL